MRATHFTFRALYVSALLGLILSSPGGAAPAITEETVTFARFGTVTLYHAGPQPSRVVLFVSGDGGWNQGVVDMARELATLDALVAGIDIIHYLRELEASGEKCSYPAGDFEELSKFIQKKLDYPKYVTPVLVGYSSGATLVYATLVQAPSTTFLGAMSLGFCPDLPLTKPFCPGSGLKWTAGPKGKGVNFLPATTLEAPWIALQGTIDQVCDPPATEAFVNQVKNGKVIILPKVGHGYSVPKNWMPQFREAFASIVSAKPVDQPTKVDQLADLPLNEVPATDPGGKLMAVHMTGDGGWGVTDKGLSADLAAHGIPVVGWNSLQYFWKKRTPDETATDLNRILTHYLSVWQKEEIVLVGYSFGADALPILVNRLPKEMQSRVRIVALLGPGEKASFEFHLTDWLGGAGKATYPVAPEVLAMPVPKILCFYGESDKEAICKDLDPSRVTSISLGTGHRIGKDFDAITQAILTATQ